MNRKQFFILLVLVAIVGAAGWAIHQRSKTSWQSGGQAIGKKLFPDFPVNDIAQITIKSGTGELNLARVENIWCVRERANYPANFSEISGLLLKFNDLKIVQSQEVGASQLGRFELLPPGSGATSGTLMEFKDQSGKTIRTLLLGKKHLSKAGPGAGFGGMGGSGWPDGRYVMTGGEAKSLALISDPLDNVQTAPEPWLNKDFFSIEKPRSIAVEFPEPTNSWKLMRASETNEWELLNASTVEKPDASRIAGVTSLFSSPTFSDVSSANSFEKSSRFTNATSITVETFDGLTYVVKIAAEQSGNHPMMLSISGSAAISRSPAKDEKPEDKNRRDQAFAEQQKTLTEKLNREKPLEKWVYLLPSYTVEPLLKTRSQLLTEAKPETASEAKTASPP